MKLGGLCEGQVRATLSLLSLYLCSPEESSQLLSILKLMKAVWKYVRHSSTKSDLEAVPSNKARHTSSLGCGVVRL